VPGALRILAIEPYFGGSHADFLDGLRAASRHQWTLLALPARKWKWRMRGAAIHFAREAEPLARRETFDAVFASDFLNLTDWRALAPASLARLPTVAFFHENQLAYPLEPGQTRDYQYGFTNLTTCLAADEVWFNSEYHRVEFLEAAAALLRKMPDYVPEGLTEAVGRKSRIMHLGADLKPLVPGRSGKPHPPPLTILWSHRWEYDKNPEAFFEVLFFLAEERLPFRLAILGETFRKWPPVFEEARRRLADRIVQFGYVPDREAYEAHVQQADIAVSTAIQERFGLSMVEAMAAGCFPLMPNRLSYPELVPAAWHDTFLYDDERELRRKLATLLRGQGPWDRAAALADDVQRFDWSNRAPVYDAALEEMVAGRGPSDAPH
jgi:glycosyltransferase involved in cell wall biosynthesis